ncbi:MAG: S8 family serine peptidase [Gammaproteobacteria bacterium]|nr:S8 family serine peptidase [Gammaproteobacteria bacterium]
MKMLACLPLVLMACLGLVPAAQADDAGLPAPAAGPAAAHPVGRLIIGLREAVPAREAEASERVQALAVRSRLGLRGERALGPRLRVLDLEQPLAGAELDGLIARLAADPAVAFVEPDARVRRHALPSDPLYPGQWYLQGSEPAAIDAEAAWELTTGSSGIVVAVLDTGVRFDHPDLGRSRNGGRLLPGYDFVSADYDGRFRIANDGDGWDADPSDPGDWVSESDTRLPVFSDCEEEDSSWHGTRVTGLIGARANNGAGVAGATWGPWILPVRVLGKCFGAESDVLQAMRWAAGLHVAGVPDNRYPARIINLSLGGEGSCTAGYQSVIDELAARDVLVVVSAGNEGGAVSTPGDCAGVMTVAGLRHAGTKVGYSNLGPAVGIAAPAGNCGDGYSGYGPCSYSLDTTVDRGTTRPAGAGYTSQLEPNIGTSFSAPQVSAIAALMLSVNGNLSTSQLLHRLQTSARPFPAPGWLAACHIPLGSGDLQQNECRCTTSTCGAGMAHAPGAVAEALRPIAAVRLPARVSAGQDVRLDASGSAAACNRRIASYSWTALDGLTAIGGADTPRATLPAPASGTLGLRLTVVDDQGASDTIEMLLSSSAAQSEAPATAGNRACPTPITPASPNPQQADSGGGGGGSLGWAGLLVLVAGGLYRRRRPWPTPGRPRTSRCRAAPLPAGAARGWRCVRR